MESYQDLDIWNRAMNLAESAYSLTRSYPKEELIGLTSQIRRAASSIPANIAEGWARRTPKEFQQFLRVASGSLRELETHLILSRRVGICSQDAIQPLLAEAVILGKQMIALHRSLSAKRS
jgi:four helix bundle protein